MRNVKIKNGVDIKWKEKAEFLCIFHPFGEIIPAEASGKAPRNSLIF